MLGIVFRIKQHVKLVELINKKKELSADFQNTIPAGYKLE